MEELLHLLIFRYKLIKARIGKGTGRLLRLFLFLLSLAVVTVMLIEVGYQLPTLIHSRMRHFYNFALVMLTFLGTVSFLVDNPSVRSLGFFQKLDFSFHIGMTIFALFYFLVGDQSLSLIPGVSLLVKWKVVYILLFLLAVFQISGAAMRFINSTLQPARLFAGSFLVFILIGSWLLILPNSLQHPISYIEALFTATSSVCITGLTVVNISTTYTQTGIFIMMILMQIGALGVLTFTTLFGLLAMGKTSIRADVIIRDMLNQNNFNEIFRLMRLILITTLSIEAIGAVWLYQMADDPTRFPFRTAVFHAISAFCNAGFSTLPDGLTTDWIRYNWNFMFALSILVILGSIGFPIVNNLRYGIMVLIQNLFRRFGLHQRVIHRANIFTLNTKIAVWMTLLLLSVGTISFYINEYNGILKDLTFQGKLTTAFFMSMTPRSGGFNCYPMGAMTQFSVLATMILMWIGGGPLSTGGGVKTTTFGLALMSIWSIMRGRDYVDIYHRRISHASILRASALIFISVVLTGVGTMLIQWFDPHIPFRNIVFEVLSAISTCGLSMDTTPLLSDPSRIVLILFMFFGRVGLLVILESLVNNSNDRDYRYPTDYVAVG